jgi:Na+/melibiose symporter-like transporter
MQVCMAMFVLILLVTAMISSIFWLWAAQRFGKFAAWQAMNVLNALSNISFFLIGEGDTYLILAAAALNGVPVGGQFLVNTIMSDVRSTWSALSRLQLWVPVERVVHDADHYFMMQLM